MAMTTRKLEPERWRAYFDWISRHLPSVRAEIDVRSPELGDQLETDTVVIDGLSYDPYNRELIVTATDSRFEHHIADPQEVFVLEELGQPSAFEIIDAAGVHQTLRLTLLNALPAPPD